VIGLRRRTLAAVLTACAAAPLLAQSWPFPWPERRIASYTARRTPAPLVIDGRLDEAPWLAAERSPRFADLVGGRPGLHDTRAAVLWDDTHLYVGFWVEEPDVAATLTERDAPIYQDNDVELFIAGRDAYYELEVNAFNTIYEVFFVWEQAFESGGYAARPEFDRTHPGVRPFNGVGFRNHPRGPRIGYWNWDMPGLETAVHVDGTLNDDRDRDRGWTVEIRIPWKSLEPLAMPDDRALPPKDGDEWRMDFSRFNTYKEAVPATDPGGWAWSPHGVWDSHVPELFTRVRFSTAPAGQAAPPGSRPVRPAPPTPPAPTPTTRFTRMFVFGDSYSDIGAGYVDGNGPTAVAYLGWEMGLAVAPSTSPGAADRSLVFAVSGAGTGEGDGRRVKDARLGYGMINQVRDFAARVQAGELSFDPETTLFFLAGGLNDGRRETASTLANLRRQIEILRAAGARRFTLARLPTRIPQFAAVGQRLNPAYETFVREEAAKGLDIRLNGWGDAFDEVMANPTAHGIRNTTHACAGRAIFDQDPAPTCDPATFFFYHDGHPSTAVHRIVGRKLFGEVAARRPDP
jgi:phospholipase/lecithinase/hemolysin